jgi:hypothetical protein
MERINEFKDVYEGPKVFEGEQVQLSELLDKAIVIKDFSELPSKYNDGTFAVVLAEIDGKTATFSTGSKVLMEQLNKIKDKLPVRVTIKQPEGKKYYTFV